MVFEEIDRQLKQRMAVMSYRMEKAGVNIRMACDACPGEISCQVISMG